MDWKIIRELQNNGRISNVELARRVGLSQSPCWTRVKNLEDRGIITGYHAAIDQRALDRPETMIVQVTMEKHADGSMADFETAVRGLPEVFEASVIAGEFDFQLKVSLHDTTEYEQFLRKKLYQIPGIRNVRSVLLIRDILKKE
ncbi:Lrp/AsnC family transcriptional regulator [Mesorhizobium sp.]|uniref:Lrp/AsnC family transcriptional regulator n=1 Tax=Mesorhizobium sp. TaxID=1871066 RepID=UPI00257E485F|nr:Lrp/AsnC family transcriptional regulator [Mesorhizobium sp.]